MTIPLGFLLVVGSVVLFAFAIIATSRGDLSFWGVGSDTWSDAALLSFVASFLLSGLHIGNKQKGG